MYNHALHSRWMRVVMMVLGSLLAALSVNLFIVPQHLYNGGVLGLCQLIRTLLDTQLGIRLAKADLAGILYLLVNIPLILLAWRVMGRTFVIKLIICTVTNSLFMTLLPIPAQPIIDDALTTCLLGGILTGFSAGLILTCGGSLGGLDIVGLYLTKRRGISIGQISIYFNVALYILCLILFDAQTAIYSAIYSVMVSSVLDRMHRQNITVQVLIITKDQHSPVPQYIMENLERGVTCWEGRGAYTGEAVQVMYVCLNKYEIDSLQQAVHKMDPHAFFVVQEGVHTGGNFEHHLG